MISFFGSLIYILGSTGAGRREGKRNRVLCTLMKHQMTPSPSCPSVNHGKQLSNTNQEISTNSRVISGKLVYLKRQPVILPDLCDSGEKVLHGILNATVVLHLRHNRILIFKIHTFCKEGFSGQPGLSLHSS